MCMIVGLAASTRVFLYDVPLCGSPSRAKRLFRLNSMELGDLEGLIETDMLETRTMRLGLKSEDDERDDTVRIKMQAYLLVTEDGVEFNSRTAVITASAPTHPSVKGVSAYLTRSPRAAYDASMIRRPAVAAAPVRPAKMKTVMAGVQIYCFVLKAKLISASDVSKMEDHASEPKLGNTRANGGTDDVDCNTMVWDWVSNYVSSTHETIILGKGTTETDMLAVGSGWGCTNSWPTSKDYREIARESHKDGRLFEPPIWMIRHRKLETDPTGRLKRNWSLRTDIILAHDENNRQLERRRSYTARSQSNTSPAHSWDSATRRPAPKTLFQTENAGGGRRGRRPRRPSTSGGRAGGLGAGEGDGPFGGVLGVLCSGREQEGERSLMIWETHATLDVEYRGAVVDERDVPAGEARDEAARERVDVEDVAADEEEELHHVEREQRPSRRAKTSTSSQCSSFPGSNMARGVAVVGEPPVYEFCARGRGEDGDEGEDVAGVLVPVVSMRIRIDKPRRAIDDVIESHTIPPEPGLADNMMRSKKNANSRPKSRKSSERLPKFKGSLVPSPVFNGESEVEGEGRNDQERNATLPRTQHPQDGANSEPCCVPRRYPGRAGPLPSRRFPSLPAGSMTLVSGVQVGREGGKGGWEEGDDKNKKGRERDGDMHLIRFIGRLKVPADVASERVPELSLAAKSSNAGWEFDWLSWVHSLYSEPTHQNTLPFPMNSGILLLALLKLSTYIIMASFVGLMINVYIDNFKPQLISRDTQNVPTLYPRARGLPCRDYDYRSATAISASRSTINIDAEQHRHHVTDSSLQTRYGFSSGLPLWKIRD
ncbi:hypothetical protein C8R44DRAFT_749681 [Mycena epipterygia]|nr:hypothetical protein C8R44DRAFT_749681 [Mycena epipterygia]